MPSLSNNGFDQGVEALESENYSAAISAFKHWLSEHPEDVDALHNLGVAQFYIHHLDAALEAWKKVLVTPNDIAKYGNTLLQAGDELQTIHKKPHLAAPFFELLLNTKPFGLTAAIRLAYCLRNSNQSQKALQLLAKSLKQYPNSLSLKLQDLFLLPIIYESTKEMDWWHTHQSQKIIELENWLKKQEKLDTQSIYLYSPIFDIMAQGRNDKKLLQQISNVWRKIFVPHNLEPTLKPRKHKHIRLGIVSGTVYEHSTMHYFHGMFEQLAQTQELETGLFYFGEKQDHYTRHMSSLVDHFLQLPMDIFVGVEAISKWEPDVLFYLDIGLESLLYTLAHLRLAPTQCVSAGVPTTTGIKTIDYYLSSHWFEPQNASQNYSETLICLDELMVNMRPPRQNNPLKNRRALNLPEDKNLYIFPHTLIRVDPELDDIFAEILKRDPQAVIYMIQDPKSGLHEHVYRRFSKKHPEQATGLQFLPWMEQTDFLNVISVCDVALDSLRLGGGNVTFQSFYVGTPMIQRPTELLRCRIASGLYHLLDMSEWIAHDQQDYIEKALKLGTNPELRKQVSEQLLAGRSKIFNQTAGVATMFNYFKQWGEQSRGTESPSSPKIITGCKL